MLIGGLHAGRISLSSLRLDHTGGNFAEDALERLREYGIFYCPSWLEEPVLESVRQEFELAFSEVRNTDPAQLTDEGKVPVSRYGRTRTGAQLRFDNDAEFVNRLPISRAIFSQDWMADLAGSYLGIPCTLNRHIILTDDFDPDQEIIPHHFDEMNALKFYVCLDDIDRENGPFQAIPGTTEPTSRLRVNEWLRHEKFDDVRQRVFEQHNEEVIHALYGQFKATLRSRELTFQVPAGSLLVFDTDTVHRAGLLSPGRRRRIIRASSYRGIWP
ncbi:phytanoyl-CoA dioxygenase family protein [Streptomyces sp. NRRL S-481]|uniref:phytanoyl-CoA dioxygenase family protein n=1 Tax=Streptomyces sp. NRRL S-481 TaxID=1463911 RepID=UPI0004C96499|nr:phytanoyl-CoA dioxygenase family protein [Streptomyces sp. NRRL S-481]